MVLSIGDEGSQIRRLQRRLRDLSYWVGSVDGIFGSLTQQAVYAFQGIEGLARDGVVGPETRSALNDAVRPAVLSTNGLVVEIDESAQVLMVAENGRIRWSIHTSTGTEEPYRHPSGQTLRADTPNGKWHITWQVDGWRDGRLGHMWRPKYFHSDGIAVHGFHRVPAFPASHGCARVTIPAMNFIWREGLAPQGSAVWVY